MFDYYLLSRYKESATDPMANIFKKISAFNNKTKNFTIEKKLEVLNTDLNKHPDIDTLIQPAPPFTPEIDYVKTVTDMTVAEIVAKEGITTPIMSQAYATGLAVGGTYGGGTPSGGGGGGGY